MPPPLSAAARWTRNHTVHLPCKAMIPKPHPYASPPCWMSEIESGPQTVGWKRVSDPPAPGDGLRVLIDRLWPRGIRKDKLIIDAWWKDLAPSAELRKWFGHAPARWDEFLRRYSAELAGRPQALAALDEALGRGPVTLLTAARNPHCNHAVALATITASPPRPCSRTP